MKYLEKILRKFFGVDSPQYAWFIRRKYAWRPPLRVIDDIVDSFDASANSVYFIQVGSNDGQSGDPIYKYVGNGKWRGVLVEPIPFLFTQLQANYAPYAAQVQFENSAIDHQSGRKTFYRLKPSAEINAPQWYDQLGTFNKDVLLKHGKHIPGIEDLLVEDEVNTISLADLIRKHQVQQIDFLHIDTEGYDYEIIKMVPFEKVRPRIILYEHKHLSLSDYRSSVTFLENQGYVLFSYDWDTIAIERDTLKQYPQMGEQGKVNLTPKQVVNLLEHNRLV
jgi:FkbM family methyltransferase